MHGLDSVATRVTRQVRHIITGIKRRAAYFAAPRGRASSLAVCAVFRDEAPYLAEWVTFHRLQGVERFYLYDNGSRDHWRTELAPELARGLVTVRRWPYHPAQRIAYTDCLRRRPRDEWIAFIDIDEFLFSPTGRSLPETLKDFRAHPGVVVNWRTFGHGGHETPPAGLVTENYLTRAADDRWVNLHIKSIVQPTLTIPECLHPHVFIHLGETVGEDHEPQVGPFRRPPTAERLRINHYYAKSREELQRKIERGGVEGRPLDDADRRVHDDVRDETILALVPELKDALERRTWCRGRS